MAKQFASEDLTKEELDRRVAAVRAAKRRAIEGGRPAHTLSDEEIDRAIEDAGREEQPMATATSNGRAAPTRCENCGREKTPKGVGYWCKPCRDTTRAGVAPTPVVNLRPPKPTYDEPTALERQMRREPAEESIERLVERMPAEVVRAPAEWGVESAPETTDPSRYQRDQIVQLRCNWSRPPHCRDDWCLVCLGNGYRRYRPNSEVEFDGDQCWVRGRVVWHNDHGVEMKIIGFEGEGTLDSFHSSRVRPESNHA